jgi:hypothetical protein
MTNSIGNQNGSSIGAKGESVRLRGRLHDHRAGWPGYVGASTHIGNRWRSHRTLGRRGKHHNPALQESFARYGVEAHRFEVVERVRRGTPLASRLGSFHFDGNLAAREHAAIRAVDPAKLLNRPRVPGFAAGKPACLPKHAARR